jgi:hypothetical protein
MQEEELKELKATKALKETDPKKYEVCSCFTVPPPCHGRLIPTLASM